MSKWKYFSEAEFVFNGEWSEPELEYKGKLYNYHLIQDTIHDDFKEFATENNLEINHENFEAYCKENQHYIKEVFETLDREGTYE